MKDLSQLSIGIAVILLMAALSLPFLLYDAPRKCTVKIISHELREETAWGGSVAKACFTLVEDTETKKRFIWRGNYGSTNEVIRGTRIAFGEVQP